MTNRNQMLYLSSKPKIRVKSRWWALTIFMPPSVGNAIWPFGVFLPRKYKDVEDLEKDIRTRKIVLHEEIHLEQQYHWFKRGWVFGLLAWYFCYVFVFPLWFNRFRWNWEWDAYKRAQNYDDATIIRILRTKTYGWLIPKWHRV